jgi:hypothetical protein
MIVRAALFCPKTGVSESLCLHLICRTQPQRLPADRDAEGEAGQPQGLHPTDTEGGVSCNWSFVSSWLLSSVSRLGIACPHASAWRDPGSTAQSADGQERRCSHASLSSMVHWWLFQCALIAVSNMMHFLTRSCLLVHKARRAHNNETCGERLIAFSTDTAGTVWSCPWYCSAGPTEDTIKRSLRYLEIQNSLSLFDVAEL